MKITIELTEEQFRIFNADQTLYTCSTRTLSLLSQIAPQKIGPFISDRLGLELSFGLIVRNDLKNEWAQIADEQERTDME